MPSIHGKESDGCHQDADDQHDERRDEAEGGSHARRDAPARALIVEDVSGGAVLPSGERTPATTSRIVPIHSRCDTSVTTFGVPASAATTAGIEVLFWNVLR